MRPERSVDAEAGLIQSQREPGQPGSSSFMAPALAPMRKRAADACRPRPGVTGQCPGYFGRKNFISFFAASTRAGSSLGLKGRLPNST